MCYFRTDTCYFRTDIVMCLNPRKIINPKRRFSQVGGHSLYMYVPCGKCAECQKKRVNEYLLRSYYEALDTFRNGGFILNDTLTYSNDNVPYLSKFFDIPKELDFMCFSYVDFRLFMVRLRTRLKKEGYDSINKLKVFCSSEYGTSEGHSHRPHYHILFFILFDIDPFYLSKLIAECWALGRTDGIPFKSRQYVLTKRLFSQKTNNDLVHLQAVTSYVTKYITKDSKFQKVIDNRLDRYMVSLYGDAWHDKADCREFRQKLSYYTTQFHRQSQGFGISALKYNDVRDVIQSGLLTMPDKQSIVKKIPIPSYYERKLFYVLTKDFRGKPQWQLTPSGVQMKLNKMFDSISRLEWKLDDWFHNLDNYMPDCANIIRLRVHDLLGNRTWRDFATYILCYKGRILPIDKISRSFVPSLDYMLPLQYEEGAEAYLYCSRHEPIPFPAVSFLWYGDRDSPRPIPKIPQLMSLSEYNNNVIDDSSYLEFKDFDELFKVFCSSLLSHNMLRQDGFDLLQHLKDVAKCLQTDNQPFFLT